MSTNWPIGRMTLVDYGRPEYLDGAMMQFAVWEGPYPSGRVVAYVGDEDDARRIAEALNQVSADVSASAQNGRDLSIDATDKDRLDPDAQKAK